MTKKLNEALIFFRRKGAGVAEESVRSETPASGFRPVDSALNGNNLAL